mmetsp:Transcript_41760/g.102745  ORF Transcript_41760/g.102745 Transcript_41760/m.102745 type:complete len:127 (-) Transcript_41760:266-646(-)
MPISRIYLDPRRSRQFPRPSKPVDKLPPHQSYLSTRNPGTDLVVDSFVPDLRTIQTSPVTDRESGSHVVAVGRDVFYTIYYPAGKFDTLSPDFNAGGLILTVGLLFCGLVAAMVVERRKSNRLAFF